MNGSIQRLASGVTVAVVEMFAEVVEAVVIHSTDPTVTVGDIIHIDLAALADAQCLEVSAATIGMLAYKVPTNRERIPA